jgi:hypothetical protein
LRTASLLLSLVALPLLCSGQQASSGSGPLDAGTSEIKAIIERFTADRGNLERFYPHDYSPARRARMQQFYSEVLASLNPFNFAKLSLDGQVDYLLLANHVRYKIREIELENQEFAEAEPLVPFLRGLSELEQGRRRLSAVDASKSATAVNEFRKQIDATRQAVLSGKLTAKNTVAYRAAGLAASLRTSVRNWFEGYNAYDPMFTWWVADPWKGLDQALDAYTKTLREKLVGIKADEKFPIVGQPAGRPLLLEQLKAEMIAYTPDELIDIANKEFAWCDKEMLRASRDLGFGDDWKKALLHVKTIHVVPGKQTQMIRDLDQ